MNGTFLTEYKESLRSNARDIEQAVSRLDPRQVATAINLLLISRGKIVLTGIGQSSLLARSIAAAFTTSGWVAVFMHPCDALHGDIGLVRSEDVVLVLSDSGETVEVVSILPHLKQRHVPIVALTGAPLSTLAQSSDVILDASIENRPAGAFPVSYAVVALAIGEALIRALAQAKGVSHHEVALNYPAGRTGRRLTLRVRDLMHRTTGNPGVLARSTLLEIVCAISKWGLGAVNVTDENNHLQGIITDGDLRRYLKEASPINLERISAEAIMTKNPVVICADALAFDALRLMENRASPISVLPVVDEENHCQGMIRLHDIVRAGLT